MLQKERIAIYGAGKLGKYVYNELKKADRYLVVKWIDNYIQDAAVFGVPIIKEACYEKNMADIVIVAIANVFEAQKIVLSLQRVGIDEIYLIHKKALEAELDLINSEGELSSCVRKWNQVLPELPYLELQIADECNLKCKGCFHFSNLVTKPKYFQIDKYEEQLLQLSKKFFSIRMIRIMGGEPLLNPQLSEYLRIARKVFPLAHIHIVTNGLLITKLSEEIMETIKQHSVILSISQYPPMRRRLDEITKFLDDNRISYNITKLNDSFLAPMSDGNSDYAEVFSCCEFNDCTFLRNGKLYVCPLIPMLYEVKEFFSVDITEEEFEQNAVNIGELNGWEIIERLQRPFSICRFCVKSPRSFKWETGKPQKEDWLA